MSSTKTPETPSNEQLLSHFVARKIRDNGGAVPLTEVLYSISDVANIESSDARELITDSSLQASYTISRNGNGEKVISTVDPIGPEPDIIAQRFGPQSHTTATFVTLDSVTENIEFALQNAGYESVKDLATACPETLTETINTQFDSNAPEADFSPLPGITNSHETALKEAGITSYRDLVQADPETIAETANSATLQAAHITKAQNQVESKVTIYDAEKGRQIVSDAQQQLPAAPEVATRQLEQYQARRNRLGEARADITNVEAQTETVGKPLAASIDASNSKDLPDDVTYTSNVGHNSTSPVDTGMLVCEDVNYDLVPKPETHPEAGHAALPVDEDGAVIPPTIPLERDLKIPLDELIAKKLARNVPVRIVGPRGSGKNYLLKYLCYKSNRGYRSLDVDKATMPQDLFGPIAPDENGKLEPKNAELKQGLLNGDTVVLNEFPVMQAGAAMALHQLLNENKLVIKSHGQEIDPHPLARIVITMNPPTREYRDSEPMNSATRGRFRSFWQGYPDSVDDEVRALSQQVNTGRTTVDETTLKRIVEFAHRTRKDELSNWPTLSTRNLTILCEHIADGASPKAATKNVLRMVAEPNQHPEDAFSAINGTIP